MEDLHLITVIAQIINFGIVYYLFKKFLGDKIVAAIENRKTMLKGIEESDQKANEAMVAAEQKAEGILLEAKQRSDDMKREAEMLAKRSKEKIISDAEREGKSIIQSAQTDVEKMKVQMFETVKSKIVDISLKLNKQLFDKELTAKDFMEKQYNTLKD